MKKSLFILLAIIIAFVSCQKDESTTPEVKKRTIIVYITSDNNISSYLQNDVTEIIQGSKNLGTDYNLVLFNDASNSKPYIASITNGVMTKVKQWDTEIYSTDPNTMLDVYKWIISNYPAHEYATIIEGHGSGSVVNKDTLENRFFSFKAYGYDNKGATSSVAPVWMNMTTMAKVFEQLPLMQFIFFDCCCMANIETAYELRKSAHYIIAPTSETPANGAPYRSVIPLMSLESKSACEAIINHYVSESNFGGAGGLCISAIKTSEFEDLKDKTKTLLQKIFKEQKTKDPDYNKLIVGTKHCIYYYRDATTRGYNVLHDMKCVFRQALDEKLITETDYNTWLTSFNNAVVFKSTPVKTEYNDIWVTDRYNPYPDINFDTFRDYFTPEYYGAISMIIPTQEYDQALRFGYLSVNQTMFDYEWCNAIGWHELGWER